MPDDVLTEEPLHFGQGGRLFGILTRPGIPARNASKLPAFVFLSAGLLHRVGPSRLHVRLARELAQSGFSSLRVDLAGKGDSPPRPDQQTIAADYEEILRVLEARLGRVPLVLAGLCSGADNAIRLTLKEPQVIGMVLLDPICFRDTGFWGRAMVMKYLHPARYIVWLNRRFKTLLTTGWEKKKPADPQALRDLPTREQLRAAFESIRRRRGRVLSVFTQYAIGYYNQSGQLGRILGVDGYEQFCTELFWPQTEHTFPLELHRRQLMEEIKAWAGGYARSPLGANR